MVEAAQTKHTTDKGICYAKIQQIYTLGHMFLTFILVLSYIQLTNN